VVKSLDLISNRRSVLRLACASSAIPNGIGCAELATARAASATGFEDSAWPLELHLGVRGRYRQWV